jgi:hypothetical protein
MDGNGRIGRLWQTRILMRYHPVFEFLPVEHLIHERQQEYYRMLARGDDSGDCSRFVAFILAQIEKSLKQLIEETRGVTLTAENRLEVARTAFGEKTFSRKDYQNLLKTISTATASRDLRQGVELGLLKRSGEKRTAVYFYFVRPVAFKIADYPAYGLFFCFPAVTIFGKKFVGIADDLFFDGYRKHFARGQRQIKPADVFGADSHADVAFTDQAVFRHPDFFQHLTTQDAVTDIRVFSPASQARTVCFHDSNVVQHGGIFDQFKIRLQMGNLSSCHKCFLSDLLSVINEYVEGLRAPIIIFGQYIYRVHILISNFNFKGRTHGA